MEVHDRDPEVVAAAVVAVADGVEVVDKDHSDICNLDGLEDEAVEVHVGDPKVLVLVDEKTTFQ